MGFCIILLLSLSTAIITHANKHLLDKRGIFRTTHLLTLHSVRIKKCHSCLVKRAGAERIILVSTSFNHHTYLVLGRASLNETILADCNTVTLCSFAPSILSKESNMKEYSLFWLGIGPVAALQTSKVTSRVTAASKMSNYQTYANMDVFFEKESLLYSMRGTHAR